jgi:hypothetical protein
VSKSTTQIGREHEQYIVDIFKWANGRRSKSSGASFHDDIDVTTDVTVTECEATQNKSYSLKKEFWKEIYLKQHSGKMPSLAIRFIDEENNKNIDLMVISADDLSALLEELEGLRENYLGK